MALWQKDYFAIPAQKLFEVYGAIPTKITEEEFLKRLWWNGASATPAPTRQEIEAILPIFKEMDGMEIFGTDAGNRIQVVYSDDRKAIIEMLIIISETDCGCFVREIVDVCAKYKLLHASAESGMVLLPDFDSLKRDMNSTKTNSDS